MDEIVPGGEHHQCEHQGQADAKPVFLSPLAERLSAESFGGIKQQMPAVKDWNRKKVDQPKIDRQNRHEPKHRDDSTLSDFSGHLRDTQRSAELISGARAFDDLPYRLQRPGCEIPGLYTGLRDRCRRIASDIFHAAAGDTEQADLIVVAKAVGQLSPARSDL